MLTCMRYQMIFKYAHCRHKINYKIAELISQPVDRLISSLVSR